MPLLSVWKSNASAVAEFSIEQVVATAGDGNLKDGSICSDEFRQYLGQIPSETIARYVAQCLSSKLDKGGMILQDLVNELGRRLDYEVTNGRYQGTVNAVGFDGIWKSPEGRTIVTEIKTTDAYRISLDTIAGYRERLLSSGAITGETSILIVVGRQDTGELEAQIRGSRHAWDVRLISAEALIKLVSLKESSDVPETGRKIRSLLMPLEYTRIDGLVDVMFTAAKDVAEGATHAGEPAEVEGDEPISAKRKLDTAQATTGTWEFTDPALLQQKRNQIINAMSLRFGTPLIKKSRALLWSADHSKRIVCTISKRYAKRGSYPYWYAYHPQWNDFLKEGHDSFLVLGCMDLSVAFAIPHDALAESLNGLNTTETERGTFYWHIHLRPDQNGKLEILLPKFERHLGISTYSVDLGRDQ